MADVFHRNQIPVSGVLTTDKAIITFGGNSGGFNQALVQNFQSNYTQQFTDVYELGSPNIYRVLGRPQGRMTIGRIVGLGTGISDSDLFDACNGGGTITVQVVDRHCFGTGDTPAYSYMGVFVIDFGVSASTQDLMIRENIQLAFNYMSK